MVLFGVAITRIVGGLSIFVKLFWWYSPATWNLRPTLNNNSNICQQFLLTSNNIRIVKFVGSPRFIKLQLTPMATRNIILLYISCYFFNAKCQTYLSDTLEILGCKYTYLGFGRYSSGYVSLRGLYFIK